MQQIIVQREVLIDAPLATVWQLVATEEGLRQWWGNSIFLEAKEGGRCEEWRSEGWHNDRQQLTHWQGVVTTYSPPHQLMLTLRAQKAQQDVPELTTIAITLEARSNGEKTQVHVTQRAFGPQIAVSKEATENHEGQSHWPLGVPLAYLKRPAPGATPLSTATQLSTIGSIQPAQDSHTQQQSDALAMTWQRRLTSLLEGTSHAQ